MKNIFHKAEQKRVYQDVVDQIQTAILSGEIPKGSKLPAERHLCEMFQTSRGTLREALRILEQKSLIEIRLGAGGGAFVKDANAELIAENLAMLIQSDAVSLEHLAEFREGVEGAVSGLAAQRASALDCKELEALMEEAGKCREQGIKEWGSFVRVDEKVHQAIAKIAGNPLYSFVLTSVHTNIGRYYDKFLFVGPHELEENYQDLRVIVDAIANHDSETASRMAKKHVRRFAEYMKQKKR
ncbi:FadR/GntR family transcriptional regulator [Desulfogranum marinum]|uniref:FadR/GntR family transcriptional regulator n=1 Tax=Desulfogranum marinum TaxID=453220 RepID=UPI0029C7B2F2|nr:FadR/GntR family transcriptional regulator [Desulfogranum marinum]